MKSKKNIKLGKINLVTFFLSLILIPFNYPSIANETKQSMNGKFIEIKILDKMSSKNTLLKLKIGEEKRYKNLKIKSCMINGANF